MYVCHECKKLFEEPQHWEERHGLDTPPYEIIYGCPDCGEPYGEADICEGCGEYITGPYVETANGAKWCEDCFEYIDE